MRLGGCLLRLVLFVVLLPLVLAMPPLAFFFLAWIVFTAYYLRKDQ
jgi:hypothetical protein